MATEKKVTLRAACRQLGYSKQAYYKSITRRFQKQCHYRIAKQKVLTIRSQLPKLGTRKLYHMLSEEFREQNIPIGRDKLFTILRDNDLLVKNKRKYVRTTDSNHWFRRYPDLIKGVKLQRPEQIWVADITYVATKEGFKYLHLITDAYSKKILGYEISETLSATSTLKALRMALCQRKYNGPLIHHSDRGLQYCSTIYVNTLSQAGIDISMTQDGSPYDNAIAERINGILKSEFGLDEVFEDKHKLEKQVNQSIHLYNHLRPHYSCSMLTPEKMHQQSQLEVKAWHKKSTRTLKGSCGFLPSLPHS